MNDIDQDEIDKINASGLSMDPRQFRAFIKYEPLDFMEAAWLALGTETGIGNLVRGIGINTFQPEPGFNPFTEENMAIWQDNPEAFRHATSQGHFEKIAADIQAQNANRRRIVESGYAPMLFLAPILDPLNFIPIPLAAGIGFARGAARGFLGTTAITGAQEALRIGLDPTADASEALISVPFAGLLGAALGGYFGRAGRAIPPDAPARVAQTGRRIERQYAGEAEINARAAKGEPSVGPEVSAEGRPVVPDAAGARVAPTPEVILDSRAPRQGAPAKEAIEISGDGKTVVIREAALNEQWGQNRSPFLEPGNDLHELFKSEKAYKEFVRRVATLAQTYKPDPFESAAQYWRRMGDLARDTANYDYNLARPRIERLDSLNRNSRNQISDYLKDVLDQETLSKWPRRKDGHLKTDKATFAMFSDNIEVRYLTGDEPLPRRIAENEPTEIDAPDALDADKFGTRWLSKMHWKQHTYLWLKNNRLPGPLRNKVARLADELAANPNMTLRGNADNYATAKSVESYAVQWHVQFINMKDAVARAYAKHRGVEDPGAFDAARLGIKDFFADTRARLAGETPTTPDGKMGPAEFNRMVVINHLNGTKSTDPTINEAVAALDTFYKEFEKAGRKLGLMGPQAIDLRIAKLRGYNEAADRRIGNWRDEIADLRNRANIRTDIIEMLEKWMANAEMRKLQNEVLIEQLEEMKAQPMPEVGGDKGHFYRMFDKAAIDANPEGLEKILFDHYSRTGGGTPDDVRVRVAETMAMIRGEAENPITGMQLTREDVYKIRYERRLEEIAKEYEAAEAIGDTATMGRLDALVTAMEKALSEGTHYRPSPLMGRSLDIPTSKLIDFIDTDIDFVANVYTRRMSVALEMQRKFGDLELEGRMGELETMFAAEIKKAETPEAAKAIAEEFDTARSQIERLRQRVLRIEAVPADPDAITPRFVASAKAYMILTSMGKAWQASMADLGVMILQEGFMPIMHNLMRRTLSRIHGGGKTSAIRLAEDEVRLAGEAYEMAMASRLMAFADVEAPMRRLTKVEQFLNGSVRHMMVLNGLSPWTDFWKRFVGSIAQSRMIEYSTKMARGEIKPGSPEWTRMMQAGINLENAKRIAGEWERAGATRGEGMFIANTQAWKDDSIRRLFRAALRDEITSSVITPGAADRLNFMSTQLGGLIMQFKAFQLAATLRFMGAGLQRQDLAAAQSVAAAIALGYFIDAIKSPDYDSRSIFAPERFLKAVEYSGAMGIFLDLNTMMETASANTVGIRPAMGLDPFIKDPNWAERTGSLLGPTASRAAEWAWLATSAEADATDWGRAGKYALPFANVWMWDGFVNRAKNEIVDTVRD